MVTGDLSRAQPFRSVTTREAIDDLRARLRTTRWTDAPQGSGWSMGTDVAELRDLVSYWAEEFDWPAQESRLNALPRFRVELDGLGIHLVHARAVAPVGPVLPLVLCHGWPDSFWRYTKVISLLTDPGAHGGDPGDAFDVVIPDMPGFGFSDRPTGVVPDTQVVAGLWARLMTVLGYERFGAAGGDMGSHVARFLALDHPDRTVAVHRMDAGLPIYLGDRADLRDEERAFLDGAAAWGAVEGGYAAMHRTKPQTVAAALADSPAGMAAWIVEKLCDWSDCGGDLWSTFTRDEVLTNLSIYWFTQTIGSSMRTYRANAAIPREQHARRVEVPSGFAIFGGDVVRPPRAWLERVANVVHVSEPPRGGHFAPFEQPEAYARDLREFFRPYRPASSAVS